MAWLFLLFQYLVPQHALSRVVGWLARSRACRGPLIRCFVRYYRVDLTESCLQQPLEFRNFNDFFTRALRPGARPLVTAPAAVLCPADGTLSACGAVTGDRLLQAKNRHFSLAALLAGDERHACRYREGVFATIYLSPRDYHRVHMPLAGQLRRATYVPGRLFSVNDATAARVPNLFARNERLVCEFAGEAGPFAVVMVGAMIVAGIETAWGRKACPVPAPRRIEVEDFSDRQVPVTLARGAELGRFFLGSTVILLFPPAAVRLRDDLGAGASVKMGQELGHRRQSLRA